jgi:hypothetical protein
MDNRHELDVRNKRRKHNYWLAKGLGFTSKEARLLCKWSVKRIKKKAHENELKRAAAQRRRDKRKACNG